MVISKSSWHYRYFCWLRHQWDVEPFESLRTWRPETCDYVPKQISLCWYTQYLFWLTVLTVVLSPLLLLGAGVTKSIPKTYHWEWEEGHLIAGSFSGMAISVGTLFLVFCGFVLCFGLWKFLTWLLPMAAVYAGASSATLIVLIAVPWLLYKYHRQVCPLLTFEE